MCRGSSENLEENRRNPKKDVQNKAANLCINLPKLPRKKRAPPTIEEYLRGNAAPEFDKDIASYYRKIYHEALDCITNSFL